MTHESPIVCGQLTRLIQPTQKAARLISGVRRKHAHESPKLDRRYLASDGSEFLASGGGPVVAAATPAYRGFP